MRCLQIPMVSEDGVYHRGQNIYFFVFKTNEVNQFLSQNGREDYTLNINLYMLIRKGHVL